ncbi:hypothetical protein F4809DRAFT_600621 [Biscogniauxia mediterranea]|nr:hypothetical protein F4809DRAFT_600621 [Biscogniauxia mediterranea]
MMERRGRCLVVYPGSFVVIVVVTYGVCLDRGQALLAKQQFSSYLYFIFRLIYLRTTAERKIKKIFEGHKLPQV